MARRPNLGPTELDTLSAGVAERFKDVPWDLFDSKDLAASGETRYMVSRIQDDLMKVADKDPVRAGKIWDEHVPSFVVRPADLPPSEKEEGRENSIEPGRVRRRPTAPEAYLDQQVRSQQDEPSVSTTREPAKGAAMPPERELSDRDKEAPNSDRIKLLLEGLEKQYLKADDRYHFRDRGREVAFEAQQKKLVTQHETPSVVGSMIDLAEAKGWSSLKLNGSEEFRREAWLQASLRDVDVTGYEPTKLDEARLEELRTVRKFEPAINSISRHDGRAPSETGFTTIGQDRTPEPRIPLTGQQAQFVAVMEATMLKRGDSQEAIVKARELAADRLTSERVHVGKLIDTGSGPYQDRKGEKESHYVTLQNDKGQPSKVWGVDLPRALEESGAKPGQFVAVAFEGRQQVDVEVDVKDPSGKVVGRERQTVERNTWKVVQFDKLREDAQTAVLQKAASSAASPEVRVFDRSMRPSNPPVGMNPANVTQKERAR